MFKTIMLFFAGDHIRTKQPLYNHHMLVIEVVDLSCRRVRVIHYNTPEENKKGISGIGNKVIEEEVTVEEDIEKAVYRDDVQIHNREAAIERARSRLHETDYKLFSNNCESFVNWALTGKDITDQGIEASMKLVVAVALVVGMIGVAMITRVGMGSVRNSRGKKDDE